MPFKSKSQQRACFAKKDPNWDCKEWADKTKSFKKLPEKVKVAMVESFAKIAKVMFSPLKAPPVPTQMTQNKIIQETKEEKHKGMSPVEYRNELTHRRTGIVKQNVRAEKTSQ